MNSLERKRIKKYLGKIDADNIRDAVEGQQFSSLIAIVTLEMHDSDYPCIEILGVSKDRTELYNLGKYHDHFIARCPINVDSFGKNIFHIMPWGRNQFFVAKPYFVSTFEITENYELR